MKQSKYQEKEVLVRFIWLNIKHQIYQQPKKQYKKIVVQVIYEFLGNINDIDMIFSEANALKNLNHKNIVKMLNCYIFKDMKAIFIMEYL